MIRQSTDLFRQSNISNIFQLNQIWNDFNQQHSSNYQQVLRFCGDLKKGITLILHFQIHVPEDSEDGETVSVRCKISCQCRVRQNERVIKARIDYVPDAHTTGISDESPVIIEDSFDQATYESNWFMLLAFYPQVTFLQQAYEIITHQSVGRIKIHAQV